MTIINKLSAFGKNDIRGVYSEDVTEELFYYVGKAYVSFVASKCAIPKSCVWIGVSRDTRLHSESLMKVLIKGIQHAGGNVVNLEMAPTPLAYYSEFVSYDDEEIPQKINAALVVTASHNPPQYNGLKMTCQHATLTENEIKEVKELTINELNSQTQYNSHGKIADFDIVKEYVSKMSKSFNSCGTGIKIVVDSANATAGIVAPKLYRELGCEVIELFSEPDGNFPNHHPNPSDITTLKDIQKAVVENQADFGIAFDGDSDRIGVVDNEGNYLPGDRLLYIYASDIISDLVKRGEKPIVVSEVKCSQVLFDSINALGGDAIMCKTGHGYIKAKMREKNAILAGEMSGHMFFNDRYYGYDDAIYAGCRIIEIFAKNKFKNKNFVLNDMLKPFNAVFTSDEVRYKCPNEFKDTVLDLLSSKLKSNSIDFSTPLKDIITLDGLRLVFDGGFALIRKSNTEPVFTLRFEGKTKKLAKKYQDTMLDALNECMKEVM